MKRIRQILALIIIMALTAGCFGCTKQADEDVENKTAVVKGEYLLSAGKSDYRLLIPKDAGNLLQTAASEFNLFFSESTGLTLEVDEEPQDGAKYISIGETALLEKAGIAHDYEELGRDGYKIVTKDSNLYLIGGADYGSLYAVYGLLERLIDYDFFAKDCYTVAQGVTEIPLYDYDLTDIPDIPLRIASDGVVTSDSSTMYRMHVRPYLENFITVNNYWAHNSFQYVQDSKDVNSKWFNASKTQLCYTAHGDKAEYKKMLKASFETMKKELKNNTERESITYTIEDNYDTCTCDACNQIVEEYGALSASIILYLNDLNKMVRDWFETEDGKPYARDLRIVFFAYQGYEAAPATYNEKTGKYEANNGISLDDGVYCQLCPIHIDYYRPITDKANEGYYTNMRGWTDMLDGKLYLWYYSCNFNYYLAPYDNFDNMADYYRFAVKSKTYYLFDQRQYNETGVLTGWANLKSYLNYKLAWDADQDMGELIDQFFEAYFGPAADEMREFFEQMRLITNYNKEHTEIGGYRSINYEIVSEEQWAKDVLQKWLDICEEAEKKIEVLKETDEKSYQLYLDHIEGEKLSVLYMFVECYSYNTSADVIEAYQKEFKEIGDRFGLGYLKEAEKITELYTKWGIN